MFLMISLTLLALLGTSETANIPEKIEDPTLELSKAMMSMEEEMIDGFSIINTRMNRMEELLEDGNSELVLLFRNATTSARTGPDTAVVGEDVIISRPPTVEQEPDREYNVRKCGDNMLLRPGNQEFLVVSAEDGKWCDDLFCTVFPKESPYVPSQLSYTIEVELYNHRAGDSTTVGHFGLMYNVQDYDNYDFVYIRPHSRTDCFRTGGVVNGKLDMDTSRGRCPKTIRTRTWFTLKVHVEAGLAQMYIDDLLLKANYPMLLGEKARGGVLVANGFNNIVYFKNLKVY